MSRAWRMLLGVCLVAGIGGCALFTTPSAEPTPLPVPRLSSNSVILEWATVRIPVAGHPEVQNLWANVDEQVIAVETRRKLDEAGVRFGSVGVQLPKIIQEHLDAPQSDANVQGENGERVDIAQPERRRLQCPAGQRREVALAAQPINMDVLWREADGVHGATLSGASPIFALKAWPLGDGRVRLSLVPEIHYGDPKNRWVGRDGMFMLETGKERKRFDELTMETAISPGETIILACSDPPRGLGKNFFCTDAGEAGQKVLLIRLAQTQHHELDTSSDAAKSLVTSPD